MFGMVNNALFLLQYAPKELFGTIKHANLLEIVATDYIQIKISVFNSNNNVLQDSHLMVLNVPLQIVFVQLELMHKVENAILSNLVPMDLSGMQTIWDASVHQELLIMVIDVLNVEEIKNGYLKLDVLAHKVHLILVLLANLQILTNVLPLQTQFGTIINVAADLDSQKLVSNVYVMALK